MEVSAITAISPNKINWRALTAMQIIKYEKQGVEVPSVYLQWAKEFIQDVTSKDNDTTTYEQAKNTTANKTKETQSVKNAKKSDKAENNKDIKDTDKTTAKQEEEKEEKTVAQEKHQDMLDDGASLRTIANSFTNDSNTAVGSVQASITNIEELSNQSQNEIEVLDEYMKNLITEAEKKQTEIKSEINKINSGKNDKNTISKVNNLQDEVTKLGVDGQSTVTTAVGNLENSGLSLVAEGEIMANANDFGNESVNIGNELVTKAKQEPIFIVATRILGLPIYVLNINRILDIISGEKAINAGNNALENALAGTAIQTEAAEINNSNINSATAIASTVESKTGAKSTIPSKNNDNEENNTNANENKKSEKLSENKQQEKIKANKNEDEEEKSTSKVTKVEKQAEKLAAGDLETILKTKLRRGETTPQS